MAITELPNPFKGRTNDKTKTKDDIQNKKPDIETQTKNMQENRLFIHQNKQTKNLKRRRRHSYSK